MSLILTPVYTENFTPDSNPLNPTYWDVAPSYPDDPMQAISGVGEAVTLADQYGAALFVGAGVDVDCYISSKLAAWPSADTSGFPGASIYLKVSPTDGGNNYVGFGFYSTGVGDGTVQTFLSKVVAGVATAFYSAVRTLSLSDVYTIAVSGNTVFGYINGVQIGSGDVSELAANNNIEFDAIVNAALDEVQYAQVIVGNVTGSLPYSEPDCRDFGIFPNSSRDVQDTEIYDVQTSDNSSVPGTDSREAGAPVDSRISDIIPLNSRTPGTFGPGE